MGLLLLGGVTVTAGVVGFELVRRQWVRRAELERRRRFAGARIHEHLDAIRFGIDNPDVDLTTIPWDSIDLPAIEPRRPRTAEKWQRRVLLEQYGISPVLTEADAVRIHARALELFENAEASAPFGHQPDPNRPPVDLAKPVPIAGPYAPVDDVDEAHRPAEQVAGDRRRPVPIDDVVTATARRVLPDLQRPPKDPT